MALEIGIPYILERAGKRAVLNDETDPDFVGYLDSENGLTGLAGAEVRESADVVVEGDSGVHGPFYAGRRPVVLSGVIWPDTPSEDVRRQDLLAYVTDARRDDMKMSWTNTGSVEKRLLLRRNSYAVAGRRPKTFQAAMVSAESAIYSETEFDEALVLAVRENVVADPSFEEDATLTDDWTYYLGGSAEAINFVRQGSPIEHGEYAGALSGTNPAGAARSKFIWTAAGIPVVAGQRWYLRARVHGGGGAIRLGVRRAAGPEAGAVEWGNPPLTARNFGVVEYGTTERLLEAVYIVPAGVTSAQPSVGIELVPAGANYGVGIDGIMFVRLPDGSVAATELLPTRFYEDFDLGSATVDNEGNADSPPRFRILGPLTNPILENRTTGKELCFTVTLGSGEYLDVDVSDGSIVLNGTTELPSSLDFPASEWWNLVEGENDVHLRSSAYTVGATLTAWWRHAFTS